MMLEKHVIPIMGQRLLRQLNSPHSILKNVLFDLCPIKVINYLLVRNTTNATKNSTPHKVIDVGAKSVNNIMIIPDIKLSNLSIRGRKRFEGVPFGIILIIISKKKLLTAFLTIKGAFLEGAEMNVQTYSSQRLRKSSVKGKFLLLRGLLISVHSRRGPSTRMLSLYIWSPPPIMT